MNEIALFDWRRIYLAEFYNRCRMRKINFSSILCWNVSSSGRFADPSSHGLTLLTSATFIYWKHIRYTSFLKIYFPIYRLITYLLLYLYMRTYHVNFLFWYNLITLIFNILYLLLSYLLILWNLKLIKVFGFYY